MAGPDLNAVKEQAVKLARELDAKRGTHLTDQMQVDPATLADMVPAFSRGTGALDEQTGEPVVHKEAAIEPPSGDAGGTIDALAQAKEEISGDGISGSDVTQNKTRNEKGQFVSEAAEDMVSEGAPAQPDLEIASAPEAKAEAAVEAKASEFLAEDPWKEYSEIEYTDPDTEKTYKVRALRNEANLVKGGFLRQADYTRKTMFLAEAKKVLEPLVSSGQLRNILPYIERANGDPEFAAFVDDAFRRRQAGLPLTQAQAAAAPAGAALQAVEAQQTPSLTAEQDPFMEQYLAPYRQEIQQVARTANEIAAFQKQQQEAQQRAFQQQQQAATILQQAHEELQRQYPNEFTGNLDHDGNLFNSAIKYAETAGYSARYGWNPLAIVLAYQEQRNTRAEAASSPAAEAIQRAEQAQVVKKQAASVSSGTPSAPPVRKEAPKPIPTRGLSAKEYGEQVIARLRPR